MCYLQESGYYTAVIGKQHFGESKIERGYDYEDIIDSHSPAPQNPDRNSYNQWLWDSGFKHRSELIQGNPDIRRYSEWKADPKYHVDHYVGDRGREWIESMPEERPWFCWISFPGPHGPIDCGNLPQAHLYDPADIDMPETNFEMLAQKPPHNSLRGGPVRQQPFTNDEIRKLRHAYYANVTLIDEKIGAIVQALKIAAHITTPSYSSPATTAISWATSNSWQKGKTYWKCSCAFPLSSNPPKTAHAERWNRLSSRQLILQPHV